MATDSGTSAAHRCLRVSEVLQLIVRFLSTFTSKRSLASFARTCKAFHEASLPALWESQWSFKPLIRLLPSESTLENTNLDAPEWERYHHHAQHVRSLLWHPYGQVISFDIWSVLYNDRLQTGPPLLPLLRELNWEEPSEKCYNFIYLFLTPSIRRLKLAWAPKFGLLARTALLERIGSVCKNIESLEFSVKTMTYRDGSIHTQEEDPYGGNDNDNVSAQEWTDRVADFDHTLVQLLHGASRLRTFVGGMILSADCAEALAALPQLSRLQARVDETVMVKMATTGARRSRDGGQLFSALTTLSLDVAEVGESTKIFLGAITSRNLQQLAIYCGHRTETHADALKEHLEVIARAPYRNSLVDLQLAFGHTMLETPNHPLESDLEDVLEPLYAFPQLETVVIESPALVIGADMLRRISNAWRNLQFLSLLSGRPQTLDRATSVYLEDLVPLALNCRGLGMLDLHVSSDMVPDEATLARLLPQTPHGCSLRIFFVQNTPNNRPDEVADFLVRLFPWLRQTAYHGSALPADWEIEETYRGNWRRVEKLLETKRVARVNFLKQSLSNNDSTR